MYKSTQMTNSPIIYEIFPRNHGPRGTFADIIDDLPRIRNLGVDIIWLMPIHPIGVLHRKGKDGCPYAIQDYLKIHDDLGTVEQFSELIRQTHNLGMKLILDMVFNHTSPDSRLRSEHPEYFYKNDAGEISTKVPEWSDVIDLDYSHRNLWDEQTNVLKYWTSLGVDGFRCDVAPIIPVAFWEFARQNVDPEHKQVWIAESVHLSFVQELRGQGFNCHSDAELHPVFDFTYDYDAFGFLEQWFHDRSPLKPWIDYLNIQSSLYPDCAQKLRFLENHDCQRIASRLKSIDQLKNWTLLMFLLSGAKLVYAGQEFGFMHLPSLFEKDTIDWSFSNEDFHQFFEMVLNFTSHHKPDKNRFHINQISETLIEIKWISNGEFISFLNLAPDECMFTSPYEITGTNVFSEEKLTLSVGDPIQKFPFVIRSDSPVVE
ncbi:MAG: alpha-amylase [Candidatus Marinimicrobia bacterium]|nr:alpha-amylase [Candidatus Neomarinimicrobiota bacterium]